MTLELPELLQFADGHPVLTPGDWAVRRRELLDQVLGIEYGAIPPAPGKISIVPVSESALAENAQVRVTQYRVVTEQPDFSFMCTLYAPKGDGRSPVIVDGDESFGVITEDIIQAVVSRGYSLAVFDRTGIVPDTDVPERDSGLYAIFPGEYGAMSAWAWGYHRVIDGLLTLPNIDPDRIVVTGHSRGGKAALLAGATDERIALTNPNNSGCGGAASFWYPDAAGEQIGHIMSVFGYWFSPQLKHYIDRPAYLPFDQHAVLSLVAPRALLKTEARGDAWASPIGARLMHDASLPVFRLFGKESSSGISYREGGHGHTYEAWDALLDFADFIFFGKPAARDFDDLPVKPEPA